MTFLIFTPLAYDIAPRFFLLNAPLIFILFGLFLRLLGDKIKAKKDLIIGIIIFGAILSNIFFVVKHFGELARSSQNENFILEYNDRILKEKTRITLGQMESVIDWIEEKYNKNNNYSFIYAQSEYERAFQERISARNIPYSSIPDKLDSIYKQGNYFVILRSQSNQNKLLSKFETKLKIIGKKNFGTLTIYYLQAKEEFITADKKDIKKKVRKDRTFSPTVQPRYIWRQIFEGCTYNKETGACEK